MNDSRKSGYAPRAVVEEDDCEDFFFLLPFLCIPGLFKVSRRDHRPTCSLRVDGYEKKKKRQMRVGEKNVRAFLPPPISS